VTQNTAQAPTEAIRDEVGLRRSILTRIGPALHACGLDDHEISCILTGDPRDLTVEIHGPKVLRTVERTIAVRVLEAVHDHGPTFGRVTVIVVD
jgi:hypothetical protein